MERKAALDRFISGQEITMVARKVQSNPVVKVEGLGGEAVHYHCQLVKPGREIHVYFSFEGCEEAVSLADVLFLLAMDATGCKMLEGFDAMRDEWNALFSGSDGNLQELDDFWHEYAGRCGQAKKLRCFLGEGAYEELIEHFE